MTIIPAIDIIDGKCVRLSKGDYNQIIIYNDDPLKVAQQFEEAGLTRLHLVDLDGARLGVPKNMKVLETIATNTNLKIDFSGGIATGLHVSNALNAGAKFICIGSMAVRNEMTVRTWLRSFGANKFIIAADVIKEKVMIKGWTETTALTVFDLIDRYRMAGVAQFICTDIERDGMLNGPSTELYETIMKRFKEIKLIASGGVSNKQELDALKLVGCSAAIIGKAIYENKIKLAELC